MIALAFDTPTALAAMAAAAPLIALFLLKRKRRDVPVSSTMLWQRTLKETMARTPFRKPSEWLSLLLMLLALIAGVLGAAGLRLGSGGGGKALVLVIDTSASMGTKQDGVTRMEIARAKAVEALEALKGGDQVTLIAAGAQPQVLVHATDDIAAARRVLDDVQARPLGCDMQAAMILALAEGRSGGEIVVLSDFCHAQDAWADLTEDAPPITLVQCGEAVRNVGITHAAVSADELGVSLLARVAGDGTRTLSLYVGEALVDAREVSCTGNEVSAVFSVPRVPEEPGQFLRATLRLEPADELETDDIAHVAIGRTDPPRILHVGAPDDFIKRLESVVPGLTVENVAASSKEIAGEYDLAIITEQPAIAPPARREFYMGCTPPGVEITSAGDIQQPELADWDSTHPLLRGLTLDNLLFAKALLVQAPPHATPVIQFREGPLLLELRGQGREICVWACGLNDSNLVLRPAFPLLVRNLLAEAVHRVQGHTASCGDGLSFAAPGNSPGQRELSLRLPDGDTRNVPLLPGEIHTERAPLQAGFYEAALDAKPLLQVGTALYDRAETMLNPAPPTPPPKAEVEVIAASAWTLERPVWQWCAAVAIAALVIELLVWLIKNRRRTLKAAVKRRS